MPGNKTSKRKQPDCPAPPSYLTSHRLSPSTQEDRNLALALARLVQNGTPSEVDESWAYVFGPEDPVYVRSVDGWYKGKVVGCQPKIGNTQNGRGLYYCVVFNKNFRKYFAPLNGEIKPIDEAITTMMVDAGYFPEHDSDSDFDSNTDTE